MSCSCTLCDVRVARKLSQKLLGESYHNICVRCDEDYPSRSDLVVHTLNISSDIWAQKCSWTWSAGAEREVWQIKTNNKKNKNKTLTRAQSMCENQTVRLWIFTIFTILQVHRTMINQLLRTPDTSMCTSSAFHLLTSFWWISIIDFCLALSHSSGETAWCKK